MESCASVAVISDIPHLACRHIEIRPKLFKLLGVEFGANRRESRIHGVEPRVTSLCVNVKRRVAHPKSRVAALLHVRRRSAPVLDQEEYEMSLSVRQVLGVHRAQDLARLNARVERIDDTHEELLTSHLLVK